MVRENSDKNEQTKDIIAAGFALATLVLADHITILHPLFGLPLFIYMIRGFKNKSTVSERIIYSMSISFISLLFTCYPIDLILAHYRKASCWDIVLCLQWMITFLFIWAIKTECEIKTIMR